MGFAEVTKTVRLSCPLFSLKIELPRPETRFDPQANKKQAPVRRGLLFSNCGDLHRVSGTIRGAAVDQ